MRRQLLASALLGVLAASGARAAPFEFARAPGVLPKAVRPRAYVLDLTPDLAANRLHGAVVISLDVAEPVARLVLNAVDLHLGEVRLDGDVAPLGVDVDARAQQVSLRFGEKLTPGQHSLRIEYDGPIPISPSGLYRDEYAGLDGKPARMLVTQFEAASARRMLPCWDEPAFKARFTLHVTLPAGLRAVSNMNLLARVPAGDGRVRMEFAPSPVMPSYLLALVAGDLASVHQNSGKIGISVWAPRGREAEGGFALDEAAADLNFYGAYFGTPYALPKLDMIAVPGNFEAGAMENWGAVTFIDDALLAGAQSGAWTQERIAGDVAHELAHQWAGDLVTMAWWDGLWLNEGLASFMASKALDALRPDWQEGLRDHAGREAAMALDAHATSHAVDVPVRDGADADSVFDEISYQKGSAIFRMIESWIGPEKLRAGLQHYMAAHRFSNVTGDDLWAALGAASGLDVAGVGRGFVEQPGLPVVRVARRCGAKEGPSLMLSQDRFTIHDPQAQRPVWQIPVWLAGPAGRQMVMLGGQGVRVALADCHDAVKVNAGEAGYFRTEYDAASLAPLVAGFDRLSAADRVNLLGDQFALFLAGRAPLAQYLTLLGHLGPQSSLAEWEDGLAHLRTLDRAVQIPGLRAALHGFARGLLRPGLARLGWETRAGEAFTDSLLRPLLVAALAQYDDADVIAQARARFQAYLGSPARLPADLVAPVLGIVGHGADAGAYDALMGLAGRAVGTEAQLRVWRALAAAQDGALIERTVQAAVHGAMPNGRILEILALAARDSGRADLVWRAVLAAQDGLRARLSEDGGDQLLAVVAAESGSASMQRGLWAQARSKASVAAKRYAREAADSIESAIELQQRVQPALGGWFAGGGVK